MAPSSPHEEIVYVAKFAEQAERYDEMVEFMEKVVSSLPEGEEPTVEKRNLLSVAYKNVIGARRASWRIVSSIEQKEESRGNSDHVATIKEYRARIEKKFSNICGGILKVLESKLVPAANVGESKMFYLKMKGDYHRGIAGKAFKFRRNVGREVIRSLGGGAAPWAGLGGSPHAGIHGFDSVSYHSTADLLTWSETPPPLNPPATSLSLSLSLSQ
ncbi:hypothetical protein COP1_028146 [Malus domestica]